jgi:hypothetical protein
VTCMSHMAGVPISLVHTLLQDSQDEGGDDDWVVASACARDLPSPLDPNSGGRRPFPPLTSPAPALLVTAHSNGEVHVWDVRTEALLPLSGALVQRPLELWHRGIGVFHASAAAEVSSAAARASPQETAGETGGAIGANIRPSRQFKARGMCMRACVCACMRACTPSYLDGAAGSLQRPMPEPSD